MDAGEGGMASPEEHRISILDDNAGGSDGDVGPESDDSSLSSEPNVDEWIREVESKIDWAFEDSILWPSDFDDKSDPKICKLTVLDRIYQQGSETKVRLSQPSVVTIGPFHRNDPTSITDKEKWVIVGFMERLCGLDLERSLLKMKNQVANARSHYKLDELESSGFEDDKRFTEMLLLDSYFILFTLTIQLQGFAHLTVLTPTAPNPPRPMLFPFQGGPLKFLDIIFNKEEIVPDLLILDNQIPFFVIEELFEELRSGKPLREYALEFFETIHPRSSQHCKDQNSPPPEFLHLLDLFHWSRVPQNKHILSNQLDSIYWAPHSTPNAMELRESATMFEKKMSGNSLDITFRRRWFNRTIGVLDIPELHIRDYSSLIFHNLIAFEMQSQSRARCTMAFSAFMHNLLQSEEDVKLLRRRGILANTSMSNGELVDFFKRLSLLIENYQMSNDLFRIYYQVLSHHDRWMSRLFGSIILQYFPNPLLTLSVFAAVLLFVLTLLQTIYTTLSYYR